MKKTIKQLEKEEARIRAQKNALIEAEENRIQKPYLKSLVGKCYAYRNNTFGGNSGTWHVYKRVLEYCESNEGNPVLIFEEFAIDCYGVPKLEVNYHYAYTNKNWWLQVPFSGYEEIDQKEYSDERTKLFAELTAYSSLKKYIESEKS